MNHESLPTESSAAGSSPTLGARTRRLSAVRYVRLRRIAIAACAFIGVVAAVTAFSGKSWARVTHSLFAHVEESPSDSTIVYGPKQFSTPTGSSTLGVERFTLPVQPNQEYVLKLENGAPDGTMAASSASVVLNGQTVLSLADLGGARTGTKVIQALAEDTVRVTVQGSAGANVTVSVLQTADPTFTVFGPHLFIRNTGSPVTETFTFNVPAAGAAPFFMSVMNGNPDGTLRASSATILLNGVQVLDPSQLSQQVSGFRKQVTLQQSNTIQVQIASIPDSRLTLTFSATDIAPPRLTVATPTDRQIIRDSTVTVSGTVDDETATLVTVNGLTATRSGATYSATASLSIQGENAIHVSAVDAAGNRTDSTRTVIHDSQAPVITLTSPTDNSFTKQSSVAVSGTVSDITTTTVNVNGVPLTVGSGGAFSGNVTIAEGSNFVTVTATDQAGNASSVARHVTLDTHPPVIAVTSPVDGFITKQTTVAVTGTVTDATAVTLLVNGTAVSVSSEDGSFALPAAALGTEGDNSFTLQATDAAGNTTTVTRHVIRDTTVPTVILTAPTDGFITKNGTVHVTGTVVDATAVTVNVNGVPVVPDPLGALAIDVPITAEGSNPILVTATDAAGNTASPSRSVILDTQAPVITVTSPVDGTTLDQETINVTGSVQDATTVIVTVNGVAAPVSAGAFTATVPLAEGANAISIVATDAAGNASTATRSVTRAAALLPGERTPPDPSLGAPPLDQTRPYSVATSTSFLYTGANPIQQGVIPDSIDFVRGAVVRGQIKTRDGAILPGVDVRVANHSEFGWTTTRSNGQFDLVVNGGGALRLQFSMPGYVPAERQVRPANNGYAFVEDLVMVPLDTVVTHIDFSQPIEVAHGSLVSDNRGQRQAALFFAQGTQATMTLPNGTTQPLASMSVRATELTVGPSGKTAMPAALPSHTAFTYAAEFSVDEANAAGATSVKFSKPVIAYLDNFLAIPTGVVVPSGSYDPGIGAWVAEQNGRVIQIASVTNGLADLIVDSTGVPASATTLQAMGVTDDERGTLASRYAVGKTLWRMPLQHFSRLDFNYKAYLSPNWQPPKWLQNFINKLFPTPDCNDQEDGSIISCQTQVLGEDLDLIGVPGSLHYESDRTTGTRKQSLLDFTITGDTLPPGLDGIQVSYTVAGHSFLTTFGPESIVPRMRFQRDLTPVLTGNDPYGRALPPGQYEVQGQVIYTYPVFYGFPCFGDLSAWGIYSCAQFPTKVIDQFGVSTSWTDTVTVWDSRATDALGGWTFSMHHTFSPTGRRLYFGDGETRDVTPETYAFKRYAGTDFRGTTGDGGLATKATLNGPGSIAFGADGSLYFADGTKVRRISRDGIIQSYGPAFVSIVKIEIGRDGSLYVFDDDGGVNKDIFKIAPNGSTTRIVGGGNAQFPEGTFGVNAGISTSSFSGPFAVGPEGEVYFQAFAGIMRLGTDGRVRTIAVPSFTACFGARIENVKVNSINICNTGDGMTVGPDGSLYFAEPTNGNFSGAVIRRVDPDGNLTTFAGGGTSQADGVLARQALLWPGANTQGGTATYMQFGPDGSLYFKDLNQVKRIGPDGKIWTVAGVANSDGSGKLGYPLASNFSSNGFQFGVGPDGTLFVSQGFDVYRLGLPFPGMSTTDVAIFAEDAAEAYIFDRTGRHLRTVDGTTGRQLLSFGYDNAGRLLTLTDEDSDVTRIERDASGVATGIVGPFGRRTSLRIGADGYLQAVIDPAGDSTVLSYHDGGLLATLTTPKQELHKFTYDSLGRLERDDDPAGGFTTLSRDTTASGYTITVTTAEGRKRLLATERPAGVGLRDTHTDEAGLRTVTIAKADGTTTRTAADGTVMTKVASPDDRLGSAAPVTTQDIVRFPSGKQLSTRMSHTVAMTDATNVFTVSSILDSTIVSGNVFTNRYDVATRMETSTSPMGRTITVAYDDKDRPTQSRVGGLAAVQTSYDAHGRVKTISRAGNVVRFDYDSAGLLQQRTDPLGHATTFEYDLAGRVLKTRRPGGQEIAYNYDANGNLTGITPSGRPTHSFSYNSLNQVQSYTAPQLGDTSTITQYRFNLDKQLTSVLRPGGDSIVFQYDTAGRQVGLTYSGGSLSFGYDPASGLLKSASAVGEGVGLNLTYDGSLPTGASTTGVAAGSITFGYDAKIRVGSITIGGQAIALGYDNDDLLNSIGALTIARSPATGLVTGTAVGTVTTTTAYDSLGAVSGDTARTNGSAVFAYSLQRDSIERVVQRIENIQGVSVAYQYSYDSLGRLHSVQRDGQTAATYEYDLNGNRQSLTTASGQLIGEYDAQDRLLRYGSVTYGYSRNGERITRAAGSDTTQYQYDAIGNLKTVIIPGGKRIDYVVDAFNRRVAKKVNGAIVRRYLYEGPLAPAAELNSSGQVTTRYVYGLHENVPDYMVRGGVTYRLLADEIGSVRAVVDAAADTVVQRIDYDEFGRQTSNSNPGFQPFGYAGGLVDEDQPLIQFGARNYDPETGSWTSKDPIGLRAGSNMYTYVDADPINARDPFGLCPLTGDPRPCPDVFGDWTSAHGKPYLNKPGVWVVNEVGRLGGSIYDLGALPINALYNSLDRAVSDAVGLASQALKLSAGENEPESTQGSEPESAGDNQPETKPETTPENRPEAARRGPPSRRDIPDRRRRHKTNPQEKNRDKHEDTRAPHKDRKRQHKTWKQNPNKNLRDC